MTRIAPSVIVGAFIGAMMVIGFTVAADKYINAKAAQHVVEKYDE